MRQRNWRLASAMDETGMSNKGLAKRVELLSAREGRPVRCDHVDIRRWCDGTMPRDLYKAGLVAQIVSDKLAEGTQTLDDARFTIADLEPGTPAHALYLALRARVGQLYGPRPVQHPGGAR